MEHQAPEHPRSSGEPSGFTKQTHQSFKKQQKDPQANAFYHRREQSANPYQQVKQNNTNFDQYQNQVEQFRHYEEQQQRSSRWKNSTDTSQKALEKSKGYSKPHNRQKSNKSQKSQDSFKNVINDENHPSVNPHLIQHPYQTKKRAESYNNKRRGETSGSLDKLDQFDIIIDSDA